MTDQPYHDDSDEELLPSKSQLKREMHAHQKLGERLTLLKPEYLAQLSIGDSLRTALSEHSRLRQREARRRHLQYIGKLIREEDTEQLEKMLDGFVAGSDENTRRLHLAERWRDDLLADQGNSVLTEFMASFPGADAQHLRNLLRNARKDRDHDKNQGHARKLFRYIREQIDQRENAQDL